MSEQSQLVPQTQDDENWRPRVFVIGGVVGAALGLLSAYLYVRAADEVDIAKQPSPPTTFDGLRLGFSLLGIVRTVTEWARRQ
ncbi:MAG: YtxH domain-containing protein [Chloroflexi bacterium]|nr:YtxH domain-containing protein [Chloroflexota bacterium]